MVDFASTWWTVSLSLLPQNEPEEIPPGERPEALGRAFPAPRLVVALATAVTAALMLVTAVIKGNQHAPTRAPCPCIFAKT